MDITLEMVDQVRERTGVSYEQAKAALEAANGSIVDAIIAIEKEQTSGTAELTETFDKVLDKIKAAVRKGNVTRIRMLRGDEELANVPVNAGIAGGVIGLMAPMLLVTTVIAGAVAKFGFDCKFQIVKEDGTVEEILGDKPCKSDACEEEPEAENEEKPEE